VSKPEWGKKHICQSCTATFYDMQRIPAVCPKCDTEVVVVVKGRRPAPEKTKTPDAKPASAKTGGDADQDNEDEIDGLEDVDVLDDDIDDIDDDEDDDDLIEDASDLGEDDDDMSEVKEHIDLGVDDKE